MPLSRIHSIRQKLYIGIFVISLVGLLISGVLILFHDVHSYHQSWVDDLTSQAELLGRASAPALQFNDPKFATQNLTLLKVKPTITAAGIYTAQGQLFAEYIHPDTTDFQLPLQVGATGVQIEGSNMLMFQPIVEHGEILGTIYLRGRYALMERLQTQVGILLLVSGVALLVSLLLAWWLQTKITQPILEVTDLARQIVESRDYTLRAKKKTNDEIGYLVDAFNDMLTEIAHSTKALEQSNAELAQGIVERQRLQDHFRLVVESAPNAMVMINQSGIIEMINAQTEIIFGYHRHELLGQSMEILLPERFRQHHPALRTSFFHHPSPRAMGAGRDLFGRRKDGSEFPVEIGLNPIDTETGPMVLSAIVDISERVKAADRLAAHASELERSNKELDTFAYVASHDLKSPLRGISQLSTWIQEDMQDRLTPEVENHLRLMRSRITRMERLLDDLLAYSRVGRAESSMRMVDSGALAQEVFVLITPPPGFKLVLHQPLPTLTTLATPFEQVLRNLFANAVKHHDRDTGVIEFSVRQHQTGYEFSVKDDGPGIAAEFHQRVFKMFQTLRPRDAIEGSGMGLAFVKKIVETYGGAVTLESDGVRGTIFRFIWPTEIKLAKRLDEYSNARPE